MIADKNSDFYIGCVRMRKPTNFDLSPAPRASSYLRRLIMDTHSDTDSDRDSTDEFTGSTSGGEGTSLSQDSVPSCSKRARYACSFHPGESNPFDWATMGGEQCQNVDILMAYEVTVDTFLWCDFMSNLLEYI